MSEGPIVVALVPNLLDRGRFAMIKNIAFVNTTASLVEQLEGASSLIVDLTAKGAFDVLAQLGGKPVYAYAGHVEEALLAQANAIEGVEAMPRSIFFRRLPTLF